MKALWAVVLVLSFLYLALWAAIRQSEEPLPTRPTATPVSEKDGLAEIARGDAISRLDPGAQTEIVSVAPKRLAGDDLHETSLTDPQGFSGFEIIIAGKVNGKETKRLRYHGAPPSRIVFVGEVR